MQEQPSNSLLEIIEQRHSTRAFSDRPIDATTLSAIIKAGTYAPTGRNFQSPVIIKLENPTVRAEIKRVNREILGVETDTFYGAPVILLILADAVRPTALYDGTLVIGNLMLAATSLGVGSCWIHRAKETIERPEGKTILHSLGLPETMIGIGFCALGYPIEPLLPYTPKARKANWVYTL